MLNTKILIIIVLAVIAGAAATLIIVKSGADEPQQIVVVQPEDPVADKDERPVQKQQKRGKVRNTPGTVF